MKQAPEVNGSLELLVLGSILWNCLTVYKRALVNDTTQTRSDNELQFLVILQCVWHAARFRLLSWFCVLLGGLEYLKDHVYALLLLLSSLFRMSSRRGFDQPGTDWCSSQHRAADRSSACRSPRLVMTKVSVVAFLCRSPHSSDLVIVVVENIRHLRCFVV